MHATHLAELRPEPPQVSVERDPLFAAIATKIIEFAGQESKVRRARSPRGGADSTPPIVYM